MLIVVLISLDTVASGNGRVGCSSLIFASLCMRRVTVRRATRPVKEESYYAACCVRTHVRPLHSHSPGAACRSVTRQYTSPRAVAVAVYDTAGIAPASQRLLRVVFVSRGYGWVATTRLCRRRYTARSAIPLRSLRHPFQAQPVRAHAAAAAPLLRTVAVLTGP
jgi:hypothetical protein